MRFLLRALLLVYAGALSLSPAAAQSPSAGTIEKGDFRFAYDSRGISRLANAHDPFGATLTALGGNGGRAGRAGASTAPPTLALTVSYRAGTDTVWTTTSSRSNRR